MHLCRDIIFLCKNELKFWIIRSVSHHGPPTPRAPAGRATPGASMFSRYRVGTENKIWKRTDGGKVEGRKKEHGTGGGCSDLSRFWAGKVLDKAITAGPTEPPVSIISWFHVAFPVPTGPTNPSSSFFGSDSCSPSLMLFTCYGYGYAILSYPILPSCFRNFCFILFRTTSYKLKIKG